MNHSNVKAKLENNKLLSNEKLNVAFISREIFCLISDRFET